MGRKSKLTPDVQSAIIAALDAGNYFETACAYAGVAASTAYEWIARGEGRDNRPGAPEYATFAEAVKEASARAEIKNVALIQTAARDTWQAAAWWLERRYPDKWGRQRHEITGADGGPMRIEIVEVSGDADSTD